MSEWFTDEELDRIARFAASPGHSRDPTMLLPEEVTDDERGDRDAADEDTATQKENAAAGDAVSEE